MTKTKTSTQDKILHIVTEHLGLQSEDTAKPTSDLIEDLGADSLDAVELVIAFEDEFSIEITVDEVDKVKTVQDCISLVESKL